MPQLRKFWLGGSALGLLILVNLLLNACQATTQPAVTGQPTILATQNQPTPLVVTTANNPTPTSIVITPTVVSTVETNVTPTALVISDTLKKKLHPLLEQLWQIYKDRYVQADGRVRDPQRTDATTSEGQSYALLRAYWRDERSTFDTILNWSINNLQLPRGDKLFAYLWGKNQDNSWGVIDRNVASDADQDIAFVLLMAATKWNEPRYQTLAQQILNDFWDKTVININGKYYLTAGDWATSLPRPVLNPSYYAPYAYRLFARYDQDKNHHWTDLVDTAYTVIESCTRSQLDTASTGKLPPNWCALDRQSGNVVAASQQDKTLDSDFGYDAFRIVWRLALDYRWNNEKRAFDYLQSLNLLLDEWQTRQKLAAGHDHTGQIKDATEDAGVYSVIGVTLFSLLAPTQANQLINSKLLPVLQQTGQDDPDPAHFDATKARTYYAQNWVWFGLAFYTGDLTPPL